MSEKVPITITKNFGLKITASYQSANFGSSMSLVLPKEIDPTDKDDQEYISRCNAWLSTSVIEETINDIKAFAGDNEKFRTILAARNLEIDELPKKLPELAVAKTSNMEV